MSIISHELLWRRANGERFDVRYKFTDHLSNIYNVDKLVAASWDTDADMLSMYAGIETGLAEIEVTEAVANAEVGIDPNIVAQHQPQNDFDRKALGQFMAIKDVNHFYNGYTLFTGVESRGGANANQRAAYLGITRPTYDLITARFSDVKGIEFFILDDKNNVWQDIPDEML